MVKTGLRTARDGACEAMPALVPGRALDIPQFCDDADAVVHEAEGQMAWHQMSIRTEKSTGELHGLLRGRLRRGQS